MLIRSPTFCVVFGTWCFQNCCMVPAMMRSVPFPGESVFVSLVELCRIQNDLVSADEREPITFPIPGSSLASHAALSSPERYRRIFGSTITIADVRRFLTKKASNRIPTYGNDRTRFPFCIRTYDNLSLLHPIPQKLPGEAPVEHETTSICLQVGQTSALSSRRCRST